MTYDPNIPPDRQDVANIPLDDDEDDLDEPDDFRIKESDLV